MERLQKYMAHCGIASRRKCEQIIADGRVRVNGIRVRKPGIKIDPVKDRVELDGGLIKPDRRKIYIMLNKPVGYVSTASDQFGRPTVVDLVKGIAERVYPVGRLDYDSEGLILLTNDGILTHRLTHPRYRIDKTYLVKVKGKPSVEDIYAIRRGIPLNGRRTAPAKVRILNTEENLSMVKMIIHEGRNRQVRRMFEAIGYNVVSLKRTAVGNLKLGSLTTGSWRYLDQREVRDLYSLAKGHR